MADAQPPPDAAPPQAKKNGSGRFIFIAVVLVLLIAGVIFGLPALLYARSHEDTDDAFIDGDIIQIAPRVAGQVVAVKVLDNQIVHKGDLLAEIDPADYQAAYESALANLSQARERQESGRLNVNLTRTTTGATVEQAQAVVEEARGATRAAEAGIGTAQSQAQAAQAGVSTAQAQVQQDEEQVATARRNVQQQQAAAVALQAEVRRTAQDYRRYSALFNQDAVSRQMLDQAAAAAKEAQSNLDAGLVKVQSLQSQVAEKQALVAQARDAVRQAQAQADTARTQINEAQARAEQSRSTIGEAQGRLAQAMSAPQQVAVQRQAVRTVGADIQAAQAAVDAAKLKLQDTKVYAPADGRVTRKTVQVGQVAQVGQNLMALVGVNVWVTGNFKETQLEHMHTGQKVDIKVSAYPDQSFSGHVDSIQAGSGAAFSLLPPENATGNYVKVVQRVPVKIVFDSIPKGIVLGPGMSVVPYVTVND